MAEPNRSRTDKPHAAPPARVRARLVLLADGSRAHRQLLRLQLERAGYRVIEAADGTAALRLCREAEPDIILSDWLLDGISGLDLCRAHRSLSRNSYGFFILLTPRHDSADVTEGMQAGADDFLTKPIAGAELLARLSAAQRVLDMQDTLSAANAQLRSALDRLSAAQDQINADLREARKLQLAMIRERQRSFGPIRVSLLMRPAGLIGGDLVGYHQIDERTVALHAIDVSGHGVAAALMTARVVTQIEALSQDASLTPAQVVRALNDQMIDAVHTDSYVTLVYGRLDLPSGQVQLVQAGHPHPVVQRQGGAIETVGRGGLPVGVLPDARFEETALTLGSGDRLLIVSDGITDAASARGMLLGEEGLNTILQLNAPLSGFGLLESMCWSVSEFSSGERQDDASALLVEHLRPAPVLAGPGRPEGAGSD